jgi:hypothetical protein
VWGWGCTGWRRVERRKIRRFNKEMEGGKEKGRDDQVRGEGR